MPQRLSVSMSCAAAWSSFALLQRRSRSEPRRRSRGRPRPCAQAAAMSPPNRSPAMPPAASRALAVRPLAPIGLEGVRLGLPLSRAYGGADAVGARGGRRRAAARRRDRVHVRAHDRRGREEQQEAASSRASLFFRRRAKASRSCARRLCSAAVRWQRVAGARNCCTAPRRGAAA